MTVKGGDYIAVAVVVRGVQDSLNARKCRVTELRVFGKRMEVGHRDMAGILEIESEIVAGSQTAQCLHLRSCDDCGAYCWGAGVLHNNPINACGAFIYEHT